MPSVGSAGSTSTVIEMIKYIGSKRTLVPLIVDLAMRLPVRSACDLFAGTTRVGQALRASGLAVHSNDLATYAEAFGLAYIRADETVDRGRLQVILEELSELPGVDGYVTEAFCRKARFIQPENGRRIDAIRSGLERYSLDEIERGIVLTSLLEAADRVDSTTGVQMAYLKSWAPRSFRSLDLRMPAAVDGPAGTVTRLDANELAARVSADLVYIDPPYNRHSYFSNYHVWETIVRWDNPEGYGVANKRTDCRERRSRYNSRRDAPVALREAIRALDAPWLLVSSNDEGFHGSTELERWLGEGRHVGRIAVDARRYVGAKIGIHNPSGVKVGTVGRLRNVEYLFLAGPDRALIDALVDEAQRRGSASIPAVSQPAATIGRNAAAGAASAVAAMSVPPPAAAIHGPFPLR